MAFDEKLAGRIRKHLGKRKGLVVSSTSPAVPWRGGSSWNRRDWSPIPPWPNGSAWPPSSPDRCQRS